LRQQLAGRETQRHDSQHVYPTRSAFLAHHVFSSSYLASVSRSGILNAGASPVVASNIAEVSRCISDSDNDHGRWLTLTSVECPKTD
jgi:hypothetical protein